MEITISEEKLGLFYYNLITECQVGAEGCEGEIVHTQPFLAPPQYTKEDGKVFLHVMVPEITVQIAYLIFEKKVAESGWSRTGRDTGICRICQSYH